MFRMLETKHFSQTLPWLITSFIASLRIHVDLELHVLFELRLQRGCSSALGCFMAKALSNEGYADKVTL